MRVHPRTLHALLLLHTHMRHALLLLHAPPGHPTCIRYLSTLWAPAPCKLMSKVPLIWQKPPECSAHVLAWAAAQPPQPLLTPQALRALQPARAAHTPACAPEQKVLERVLLSPKSPSRTDRAVFGVSRMVCLCTWLHMGAPLLERGTCVTWGTCASHTPWATVAVRWLLHGARCVRTVAPDQS